MMLVLDPRSPVPPYEQVRRQVADQAATGAADATEHAIARAYRDYAATLEAYQAVDFDDLIRLPLRLLDEHEQSRADHSQRLYALLMLEIWWRQRAA